MFVLSRVPLSRPLVYHICCVLRIRAYFNPASTCSMLHAEAEDWSGVVVADFFLFSVEAYALADDCGFGAVRTPDWEGHFKAYGEDALGGLVRAAS